MQEEVVPTRQDTATVSTAGMHGICRKTPLILLQAPRLVNRPFLRGPASVFGFSSFPLPLFLSSSLFFSRFLCMQGHAVSDTGALQVAGSIIDASMGGGAKEHMRRKIRAGAVQEIATGKKKLEQKVRSQKKETG